MHFLSSVHQLKHTFSTQISYEKPKGWGSESLSNGAGHLTKMVIMPISGKNRSEISFSLKPKRH